MDVCTRFELEIEEKHEVYTKCQALLASVINFFLSCNLLVYGRKTFLNFFMNSQRVCDI